MHSSFGQESLRWALVCMLAFYALALLIYAWTIKPYASMVTAKRSLEAIWKQTMERVSTEIVLSSTKS
jgi:hypothetical protein